MYHLIGGILTGLFVLVFFGSFFAAFAMAEGWSPVLSWRKYKMVKFDVKEREIALKEREIALKQREIEALERQLHG